MLVNQLNLSLINEENQGSVHQNVKIDSAKKAAHADLSPRNKSSGGSDGLQHVSSHSLTHGKEAE